VLYHRATSSALVFVFVLLVLGFELSLTLARQVFYHMSHSTSPSPWFFETESWYAAQTDLELAI
jgi:hypothetical protein